MGRIYDTMVAWFREDDWNFQEAEEDGFLVLAFQGKNATWQCFAQASEEREQFVLYSVAPVRVAEDKLATMAEFLTRANYGLVLGNFELDYADGEVRYKTSFDASGVVDLVPLFMPCVYANVLTADRYFPGITAVLYASQTPEEAIAFVET